MNLHRYLNPFLLLILFLSATQPALSQQTADSILSLKRIYFKPYIAGSRPTGQELSPDGKIIIFQWDDRGEDKYRRWMINSDGTGLRLFPDTLIGEIEWSPDGKTVACTRSGDIFLADTGFHKFERLTKTDSHESGLRWTRDGKLLGFYYDSKIMVLPVGKSGMIEGVRPSAKDGWANFIDFTPDGKRILFSEWTRDSTMEFIVPKYTGKFVDTYSFKSGGVSKVKLGLAPTDTGTKIWIKFPGDERFALGDIAVSPDSKWIVVERFLPDKKTRELFLVDTDSGKGIPIFKDHDDAWIEGGIYTTRWMPDGKYILTSSERDGWNHLYMMSQDGGGLKQFTEGQWEVRWFDIHPSGEKIFFLGNRESHQEWHIYSLDIKSKAIARLTTREGSYESPAMSKDGSLILARFSGFTSPQEIVIIPTSGPGLEHQLTNNFPDEFRRVNWVVPDVIHFKSKDGKSISAMIYKPKNFDPLKKYPVVVFVHGAGYLQNVYSGWTHYYREYMFHTRLTQRGYVVFEVDYRGSAGYGRDFRTDVYMHLGGKDLQDEVDGIEYLKSLGYIDPGRVGIYGGSYGGFLTLMGLFVSDEYACGAALRAVTSWENYYRHNTWYTEPRLGKPEDNPEAYKISSPITYADSLRKPLLILHGMVDDNVFFQDAVQLVKKLQRSGKKFELMVYPDEAHSFSEPESWYDEYSRIEEFFDKYLK